MADPVKSASPPRAAGASALRAPPVRFLVASAAVVAIAVTALAALLLVHLRTSASERARQTLSSVDILLAEQTERSLNVIDLTIKDTVDLLLQRHGAAMARTIHALYGGTAARELLRAEAGGLPQLSRISIFDSRGILVSTSEPGLPAKLDISRRQLFQRARESRTPVRFLSEPIRLDSSGVLAMIMVRRLNAPDGSFAGIIAGVIPLDYFTRLYHDIYLGQGTAVSLFNRDGVLLARYPTLPEVGHNLSNEVVFKKVLERQSAGVVHSTGHILKTPLFIATHALNDYTLAVNVIMTDARVYADWRKELTGTIGALALVLGLIGLLSALALRHFASYVDLAEARLETTRAIEARARAEAMTQAKSRFLANMSHELRTPLNAIIGFAEIIEIAMLGPLQQRYSDYARDIRSAGAHLLEVVNDILDLSKAEANALKVGREPLDVADIVRDVDRIVRDQATRANVTFAVRLDEDLPPVIGDRTRLRQILINLVSNALKFTPPGGSVTVSAYNRANRMVIEVRDTGIGMAEEDIPAALAPFEQLDNRFARKYEGTGLGLPLTKHLVELLGGRFSITSAVNRGTTVEIELDCLRRAA
jgi:signal transduction histidine kinase